MTLESVKREIVQSVEFADDSDRRLIISCSNQKDFRERIVFTVCIPDLKRWFEVALDKHDVESLCTRLQKWKSMVDKGEEIPGSIIFGYDDVEE